QGTLAIVRADVQRGGPTLDPAGAIVESLALDVALHGAQRADVRSTRCRRSCRHARNPQPYEIRRPPLLDRHRRTIREPSAGHLVIECDQETFFDHSRRAGLSSRQKAAVVEPGAGAGFSKEVVPLALDAGVRNQDLAD